MEKRKAIRAVLLAKTTNEILLMRCEVPDSGESHWITPGGGINEFETEIDCLKREVREETGFAQNFSGYPIWVRDCIFTFNGVTYQQSEKYYLINVNKFKPVNLNFADELEMNSFREFKWWSHEDILNSKDLFIPNNLGNHLKGLLSNAISKQIIDVS